MNKLFVNNKLVIFSVIFTIVLVIFIPLALSFLIKVVPGGVQPPLRNTIKIYGGLIYSQSFISPENNLTGIGVSIKNPNFANKKPLIVNLNNDNGQILRTITLNGQNIADGKFVKILFDPIQDSKNKKYSWSVASTESAFDDALEIFITDKQPTWSLGLSVNDKQIDDGLSYVTLHRPGSKEVLNKIVGNLIYKIKGDSGFFLVYGFLILLILSKIIFSKSALSRLKK